MSNRKPGRRAKKLRRPIEGRSIIFGEAITPSPSDAAADLAAVESDRRRFEGLPALVSFLRPPLPGELRYTIPPGYDLAAVDVQQVRPGVRVRRPIFRRLDPSEIN